MLPSDKLTPLRPVWKMKKDLGDVNLYRASLILPRICPLNKIKVLSLKANAVGINDHQLIKNKNIFLFQSCKRLSWETAQQDAALKACERLYQLKEIDDFMLNIWKETKCNSRREEIYSEAMTQRNFDCLTNIRKELGLNSTSLHFQNGTCSQDKEDVLCNIIVRLN